MAFIYYSESFYVEIRVYKSLWFPAETKLSSVTGSGFAELFVDCGWCFSLNLQPLTELVCKGCVLNHNKWPHVVQRVGFLSESLYSTLLLSSSYSDCIPLAHTCASLSLQQDSFSFPSYVLKTANRLCCASSAWEVVNRELEWVSTFMK